MRVELTVVVAAILWSLITKLLHARSSSTVHIEEEPTIFVGIVAYCDAQWPEQIRHLLETASSPRRLMFGVVEYVVDAEETMAFVLPVDWRHRVRVYTVSHVIATSQRAARRLCFDETYKDETFVLFSRGWASTTGWDVLLTNMMDSTKNVLSVDLSEKWVATFPCIDPTTRAIVGRELKNHSPRAITSLVCQNAFTFSVAAAVEQILSSSDEYEVSEALVAHGYELFVPGCVIGVKDAVPRGVKAARKALRNTTQYMTSIGVHKDRVDPAAVLGLQQTQEAAECIAKYGSVTAARVAYQTERYRKAPVGA